MSIKPFQVEETNTYVRIFDFDKQTEQLLKRFCIRTLSRWAKVPGPTYKSYKFEISHVFASFSPDKTELRLVKGFYNDLIEFVKLLGLNTEGIIPFQASIIKPEEVNFKWKNKEILPRDKDQKEYLDFTLDENNNLVVINMRTGAGKANCNSTPVQTPLGWTAIESLRVGDKVIAKDGTVTTVTGIYPQGELPINEVTFYDGRRSYCCDDHLWKVFDIKTDNWEVIDTNEIKNKISASKIKPYIPLPVPYDYDIINIPFKDYWLHSIMIGEKIPDIIFKYDTITRLKVFHWITKKSIIKKGIIKYTTWSEQLASDIQKLVRSLGGIAKVQIFIKENKPQYCIFIRHRNYFKHDFLKLKIKSIEPAGIKECTCISVAHPERLFIIDDYVVTHNTVVGIMAFVKLGYRVLITVLPRYVSIWHKSFAEFLDLKPEDVLNISDHDINEVYESLKNKTINPKIVFFQLTRINTYIKRMREAPDTIPHLDDFFKVIAPGVRLIDEAHESIYSVYSSMLYGNIEKNIALSATLMGSNEFLNKIYKGTFPYSAYLKPPIYDKYMHVVSYYHRMNINKYRINTKGFGGYSHILYEKGILRKNYIFENYYQMCKEAFIKFYIEGKREGQKAIWFFVTVAMCNRFANRLKLDYPELDIFVFTGDVSKKKGMEQEYNNHEVVVTTPGSCSTGKDIEKLYIIFAGVSVSSMQLLDQMSGRARPVNKWWNDLDPIFLTFVCRDVRKQVEYDGKKKQIIGKKAKKFTTVDSFKWV